MSGEDESLLTRWSRLKRQESAEPEPGETSPDADASESAASAEAAPAGDPASAEDEERMLTEADLPDIESLTYESDFSVFMKANVPLALQKRALRKLWVSNPVLANLDGLNDHDLDYTISEMKEIAAQSAADLARNAKRLNVTDLRAKEREMRRMAAAQKQNQRKPAAGPASTEQPQVTEAAQTPEQAAERDLADYVTPATPKLDS